MERLGLGPEPLLERNPRLVYGRITGFGQEGPLAALPGHDINYIALSGVLGAAQRAGEKPMFAINTVADYGGGAMLLGLRRGLRTARGAQLGARPGGRRGDGRWLEHCC